MPFILGSGKGIWIRVGFQRHKKKPHCKIYCPVLFVKLCKTS